MRKVVIGIGIVAVLAVAALLYVASNLDELIRRAIESYGSDITGTPVRVADVETTLAEARASIEGFNVANPSGFGSTRAFSLGLIRVELDPASLPDADPLVIREIRIAHPIVSLELDEKGRSNVSVLQANIERYTGGSGSDSGAGPAGEGDGASADGGESEQRIIIERISFEGGEIRVDATRVGDKELRTVDLPAFTLRNIGRRPSGVTPGEAGKEIMGTLAARAARVAATARLSEELSERLGEAGEVIGEGVNKALDELFGK